MLSTHNVVSQPKPHAAQSAGGAAGAKQDAGVKRAPETGQFDFLSYLLGLSAATPNETPSDGAVPGAVMKPVSAEESQDPLARLFNRKRTETGAPALSAGQNATPVAPPVIDPTGQGVSIDVPSGRTAGPLIAVRGHEASKAHVPGAPLDLPGLKLGGNTPNELSESQTLTGKDLALKKYAASSQKTAGQEAPVALTEDRAGTPAPELKPAPVPGTLGSHAASSPKKGEEAIGADRKTPGGVGGEFPVGSPNVTQHGATLLKPGTSAHKEASASVGEVFHQVQSMVHNGGGTMTVSLDPPELGKLEIQVKTKGNRVEIEMRSENELAKSVLESRMTDLKHSMHAQDLVLHKMEVHVEQAPSQRTASGHQFSSASFSNGGQAQSNRQGTGHAETGRAFSRETRNPIVSRAIPVVQGMMPRAMSSPGSVDIRI